jgi:hypothetical protein
MPDEVMAGNFDKAVALASPLFSYQMGVSSGTCFAVTHGMFNESVASSFETHRECDAPQDEVRRSR